MLVVGNVRVQDQGLGILPLKMENHVEKDIEHKMESMIVYGLLRELPSPTSDDPCKPRPCAHLDGSFIKLGDPNIDPKILVPILGTPKKVPLILGNLQITACILTATCPYLVLCAQRQPLNRATVDNAASKIRVPYKPQGYDRVYGILSLYFPFYFPLSQYNPYITPIFYSSFHFIFHYLHITPIQPTVV